MNNNIFRRASQFRVIVTKYRAQRGREPHPCGRVIVENISAAKLDQKLMGLNGFELSCIIRSGAGARQYRVLASLSFSFLKRKLKLLWT